MEQVISGLVERYERGRLSRRELIQGLAAVTTAGLATRSICSGSPAMAAPAATFQGVSINHIALRVTDVKRSRDFYQKHLGLPVVRESQRDCFLGLGKNFLALFQNQAPGMDHYCLAIENFRVGPVTERLKREGFTPRQPSGTERVYFPDPDGLVVQLSAADHQP